MYQLAARSRTEAITAPELEAIVGTLRVVLNTMAMPLARRKLPPAHLAEAERLAVLKFGRSLAP